MQPTLDLPQTVAPLHERVEPNQSPLPLQAMMEQLRSQHSALERANAAIHAVLARIEEERDGVQASIVANVDKVLMPLLHALEAEVPLLQKKTVALVRQNLEEIACPFTDRLSRRFPNLTPLEIRICRMLRDDLTTKEIAQIRHVSPATVARQRERIRRKLGLTGSDTNLTSFLRSQQLDPVG